MRHIVKERGTEKTSMKKFTPVDFPRFVNFEFVISFLLRTLAYSIVLFLFSKKIYCTC